MKIDAGLLQLSANTVADVVSTGDRLRFPAWVDENKFSSIYKQAIYQPTLTPEKAFYVALTTSKRASAKQSSVLN